MSTAASSALNQPAASSVAAFDRERLIEQNLPQVRFLARRIHERLPRHVALEDLVGAGMLGLMEAAERYRPATGVQFSTFAQYRIRGAILDSLRQLDWGPRELRQRAREAAGAGERLTARLGRTPSREEVAAEMGIPVAELEALYTGLHGLEIVSLDAPLEADQEGGATLASELPAAQRDALAECISKQEVARLAAAMEKLPERERTVLALYYFEELPMKAIARVLGVVDSRASQIHTGALAKLRGLQSAMA